MKRLLAVLLLVCSIFSVNSFASAAAGEEEAQAITHVNVGIVILANGTYLTGDYQDIVKRYFVKCYSKYRYPMEYGPAMQEKFFNACQAANYKKTKYLTDEQLTAMVQAAGKDQLLVLRINEALILHSDGTGRDMPAMREWLADMDMEAILLDKNGVIKRTKMSRSEDNMPTAEAALYDVFATCIHDLQKKDFFQRVDN